MNEQEAKTKLISLGFSQADIGKLEIFHELLLDYNLKYNLISKSTVNLVWSRHILDSAQLLRFFNTKNSLSLADLGSGAGFPGIILAIYNKNTQFHVKLYEKSPVKRHFLDIVRKELGINFEIFDNVYGGLINDDIIVCRAFKKLDEILKISREIVKKNHRIIILKGKNAQDEINKVSLSPDYSYKLLNSITDADSKIIIINALKNEQ
jgi:16S rRNA (guanine527-N7)-methyltransferase